MDGYVTIGTELDTKNFETQIKQVEKELKFVDNMLEKRKEYKLSGEAVEKFSLKAEKLTNQLVDLRKKQEALNKQGFNNIKASIENIGNGIEKITKKVVKWGLAIFGIRSAYMFVRQSMSTLSQYDEQMATDIEYIRWALATTIKPLVEWIIRAVYDLLSVIGDLAQSLFNVNIFANASADAFKKAKSSIGGANKEAKQLQKTLAGFDEMNILQEDGSVIPSTISNYDPFGDLAERQQQSKSGLVTWWEDIVKFWEEDIDDFIDTLDGNWATFFEGILRYAKGLWDTLKGFGEVLIGIIQMIFGLVTGDFELVKQGFSVLIKGIKDILTGFFEMVGGTILVLFGFIKGVVLDIWNFIYGYIIKPVLDFIGGLFSKVGKVLDNIFNKVKEVFENLIGIVAKPFNAIIDGVKNLWKNIKKPLQDLVDKILGTLNKLNPLKWIADLFGGSTTGFHNLVQDLKSKSSGRAKGGVFYPSKLPKLAVGGIINNPGAGVPYHGSIIGERGAEAVVPLTDSQQMELLGSAIGRYITVNLTNVTELDGRQIARKVDKIQQNNSFVLNR